MTLTQKLSLAWQRVNNHGTQPHAAEAENCGNIKGITLENIRFVVFGYLHILFVSMHAYKMFDKL